MSTITKDQNSVRRTIAGLAVAGLTATACLFGGVAGATAAEAAWVSKTTAGEHKPKRWHCAVLNICSSTPHMKCGNPNIAYTKPPKCVYTGHNDRY